MSYQYFKNFIYKPLQNNKKLFLKELLDVFCNLTASGIKTIQASGRYGGTKFDGWVNNNLYTNAKSINVILSSFTYYFYNQLYDNGEWNYIVLSKEMSIAINSYAGRISTGEWNSVAQTLRNDVIKFLIKYKDVIINELMRVQNGGSPNYDHIDKNGTEKIILYFEIIKNGFIVKNKNIKWH